MKQLDCDYLVVGCGATSMAFLDELILMNSTDLKVIVVDRRAKPGGHWVDAYDFVRLHQPSATYGVNSRPLGNGNFDLTSKYQILAYYELVMADMLATGQLQYFPQCEYKGNGKFTSLIDTNLEYEVDIRKKTVDATIMETSVPSTTSPNYNIEEGLECIPINGLARLKSPYNKYVVIGAGKTGLDAILYLLDRNIPQENIQWIVSNDCWYMSRLDFDQDLKPIFENWFEQVIEAESLEDLYLRYEKCGIYMRLDKKVWPTKNRAATVSVEEMERFRTITNIIREGRIGKITKQEIIFENGNTIPTEEKSLFIDCSAAGTKFQTPRPIFPDKYNICLQMLQLPAPTYSGAIIAAAELQCGEDLEKLKELGEPLAAPQDLPDWFHFNAIAMTNQDKIASILGMKWLYRSRLSGMKLFGLKLLFFFLWSVKSKTPLVIKNTEKIVEEYKQRKQH